VINDLHIMGMSTLESRFEHAQRLDISEFSLGSFCFSDPVAAQRYDQAVSVMFEAAL